jgi:hypothetical protein
MIEFFETHNADGTSDIRLVAPALPKAYDGKQFSYTIRLRDDGWCECKSRADGPGSTRYYAFRRLDDAFAHGMKWAKRKIAESKRGA